MKNFCKYILLPIILSSCSQLPKKNGNNLINKSKQNLEIRHLKKRKDYTLLVEKLMGQKYIPDIKPSSCFEENAICLNVFFLYKINVQRVISGEPLKGIIKVARYQHGEYRYKGSDNALFIIEKIRNEKTRLLLKTDYFITEYITPKITYCLPEKLDKHIPEFKELIYSNCLEQKDVYEVLKDDLIELVDTRVERELRNKNFLIKHEYGFSDGVNFIPDDLDDDENCPSYVDLDKYNDDKNCILDDETKDYEVRIYEVTKGKAPYVKQLVLDELSNIKISLDNVKINF